MQFLISHEAIDGSNTGRKNRWETPYFAARFADTIQYLIVDRQLPLQFLFVAYAASSSRPTHTNLNSLWKMFSGHTENSFRVKESFVELYDNTILVERVVQFVDAPLMQIQSGKPATWESYYPFLTAYALSVFRVARYRVAVVEVLTRLALHLQALGMDPPSDEMVSEQFEKEMTRYHGDPRTPENFGLVREKEGGFLWMHLDARRTLLDRLHDKLDTICKKNPEIHGNLVDLTLRLHWYVARWYGRLMLSSLDPLAASQGVDHIFRGLEFAVRYAPQIFETPVQKLGTNTLRRLPIVMVRHARHILGVAEPLFARRLSDQFANLALESLLEGGLNQVRTKIEALLDPNGSQTSGYQRILYDLGRLELQIIRMYTTLQRTSGRFTTFLNYKPDEFERDVLQKLESNLKRDFSDDPADAKSATELQTVGGEKDSDGARIECESMEATAWQKELRTIKLDLANCLLCSRRYAGAHKKLTELLAEILGDGSPASKLSSSHDSSTSQELSEQCEAILNWAARPLGAAAQPKEVHLSEVVQVLERLMYLEMHRSQAIYLAWKSAIHLTTAAAERAQAAAAKREPLNNENPYQTTDIRLKLCYTAILDKHKNQPEPDPGTARRQFLQRAIVWGETGLKLLRHLAIADGHHVYIENVRLRAHHALCEALLAAYDTDESIRTQKIVKSKRLLVEAQAYLDEYPLKHAGKLRAVFELRCGEIAILEAVIALGATPSKSAAKSNPPEDRFHRCLAHAYDSLRAIKRAEVILENHRKSRWWWWILLVLKTKACECLYKVRDQRLLEFGESVKGLIHNQKTIAAAKTKLSDLRRQIPPFALQFLREELAAKVADTQLIDPFFLARIVHSFRKICEHDLKFEHNLLEVWQKCPKLKDEDELPDGRSSSRPRVRLTDARQTLRALTKRLEKIRKAPVNNPDAVAQLAEIDFDTLAYSDIVAIQARWDVEYEPIWKA